MCYRSAVRDTDSVSSQCNAKPNACRTAFKILLYSTNTVTSSLKLSMAHVVSIGQYATAELEKISTCFGLGRACIDTNLSIGP